MADLFTLQNLIAFFTLASLEIVLGIDNIVFISILVGKLPESLRTKAMRIGLGLAMIMRIMLLLLINWVMGLTKPLFEVLNHEVTGKDLILIVGGLFLIGKSTHEIHDKLEAAPHENAPVKRAAKFGIVLVQILLLDIVFSLDSVITAVGMVDEIAVMIAAVVAAVAAMMIFARPVEKFVSKHPTVKILALSFLILIGVMLVADGFGHHIPKGYIYFAMAFSLGVEMLNMRLRKVTEPVQLHEKYAIPGATQAEQGR